jgi:hypothetical protein
VTQRLPVPGGDDGDWGDILNGFLGLSLASDGTLNPIIVGTSQLQTGAVTTTTIANNAVTNTQLDSATQTSLAQAASAYVKPSGGIPSTDLSSAVQAAITAANSSVQTVNGKSPTSGAVILAASDVGALTESTADGLYAPSGAYAAKPVPADKVLYVSRSVTASDSNDGLSWGTAKATIAGAIAAQPGGALIQLGAGTFNEVAQETWTGYSVKGAGCWACRDSRRCNRIHSQLRSSSITLIHTYERCSLVNYGTKYC